MNYKKAVIAGYICLDIHPDFSSSQDEYIRDRDQIGSPIEIGQSSYTAGGLVPGVGLALNNLGLPLTLIGKIGDDPFGETVKGIIEEKAPQLLEDLIIDPATPTGYRLFLDSVYYFPGANKTFYASDIRREVLREADLFHFGYPSMMRSIYRSEGGELVSVLQRARREGLSTSLDFGLPDPQSQGGKVDWQNILENTLPLVDVFMPDVWQLLFFLKPDHYQQLIGKNQADLYEIITPDLLGEMGEWVLGHGVKVLLVDMGERGLYLRTKGSEAWSKVGRGLSGLGEDWFGREMWLPACDVKKERYSNPHEIVTAGFFAGVLSDSNPEISLKLSSAARAAALENVGDPTNLPPWEDLLKRIDGDWEFLPLQLKEFGFRKGKDGIWEK